MPPEMQIDGQRLVDALKAQRNGQADEAATLRAALDTAMARIAELEAEVAQAKAREALT